MDRRMPGNHGFVVGLVLAITACSSGQPADVAPSTSAAGDHPAAEPPPIHLDQTTFMEADGVPIEEKGYREALDACRKSGIPTQPLSADDTAKLGRTHLESWLSRGRAMRHTENWTIDVADTCQFRLKVSDVTEIDDATGKSTLIDNVAHTGDTQDMGAPVPAAALDDSDGKMDDAARMTGWQRLGEASSNGHACTIWRDRNAGETCIWNEGHAWGYTASGVNALHDGLSAGQAIVLWGHPGTRGADYRLETRTFTVGLAVPEDVFRVPAALKASLH